MAEDLKQLARRFYDAVNAGDMDGAMSLVGDDFVDHEEFPGVSQDREGVRQFFGLMRNAFPDYRIDIEDMLVEADKIAVRMRMSGTPQGHFLGTPGTGRRFAVTTIDFVRVVDGKAVEHWGATDTMGMMQQLGSTSAGANGSAEVIRRVGRSADDLMAGAGAGHRGVACARPPTLRRPWPRDLHRDRIGSSHRNRPLRRVVLGLKS